MEEEQQRLAAHEQSLDQEQLRQLIERTRELIRLQHTPNDKEALSMLPSLALTDLEQNPHYHEVIHDATGEVPMMVNELKTNSIVYLDIGLDCSSLGPELLPWLDLFGTIATEISTTRRDYMRLAKDINISTGGFGHSFATYLRRDDPDSLRSLLWFQVKALSGYLEEAVSLVAEVFGSLALDNRQRIREIVQREFAWAEHGVQSEGYSLASTRVFAQLGRAGMINEHVSGATAYLALKELASDYDGREDEFLATLETLRDQVFSREGIQISVTGEEHDVARCKQLAPSICNALAEKRPTLPQRDFPTFPRAQAFCTSAEVMYNVMGCRLFDRNSRYSGHFEVVKTWLSRDYLWNTVRQVGGAYGCFVQFNHISGNFGLVSYRDPQVAGTYAAYKKISQALAELELEPSALDQLIIGTYGSLNPHQGPAAMAMTARNEYLSGITPEYKQQRIGEVIGTTVADLCAFSPRFRALEENSFLASVGNREKIKENKELFDDILEL